MDGLSPSTAGGGAWSFSQNAVGTPVARNGFLMRIVLLSLVAFLHLALVSAASATTADDICASTDDPCLVKVLKNGVPVTSGSTLDFGDRTLRVPPGAKLIVSGSGGTMTISAGAVDVQATSQGAGLLLAVGGTINVTATTGNVSVHKMGNSVARVDASGEEAAVRWVVSNYGPANH